MESFCDLCGALCGEFLAFMWCSVWRVPLIDVVLCVENSCDLCGALCGEFL